MNFFERQDRTRRATRRLIVLFALAVVAVVAAIDLAVFALLARASAHYDEPVSTSQWLAAHPGTVLATTLLVLSVIALASLYKTMVLGGGGGVVARTLGGVRVSPDTTDPLQRRLLNVVEEMAIASGVPMPEVYLLEHETGINAFAAGHNPANAALGVTRGALRTLDRSELQGVVAHEFSHILNGDMRLNMRLMGLLFGLLVLGLIGRIILRVAHQARSDKHAAAIVIVVAAGALIVFGYVGLLCGRLIQAAVSRTREALADASAVQFTRNPAGLRGALLKIGASTAGSRIANAEVEEVAHMLFASGMRRLFATHPPLIERLRAIDPGFRAEEIEAMRARLLSAPASESAQAESLRAGVAAGGELPAAGPASVASLVGSPATAHVQLARRIRASLPEPVVSAGRHPLSARALLLALVLDSQPQARKRQQRAISEELGADVAAVTGALEAHVEALAPEQRMPALLRSFPALRQLAREERLQLMACLNGMMQHEDQPSLQSYALRKLARAHLHDDLQPAARIHRVTLNGVSGSAQVLFSVLAQHGHATPLAARRAYEAGMSRLFPRQRPAFAPSASWAEALDRALERLDRLVPPGKELLIEAMLAVATHDQQLTLAEAELLRAVCAALHCPLPPLVESGHGAADNGRPPREVSELSD